MIVKGQKRKLHSDDEQVADRSSPFWENQRQFVFSVSLNKYQRSQELPEPNLRRSVLIANTLRQVSLEACEAPSIDMDPAHPTCASSSSYQEKTGGAGYNSSVELGNSHSALASSPISSSDFPLKYATGYHSNESNVPVSVKDDHEDWGSVSADSDFSLSAAISSILTVLDSSIDGSQQLAPRMPLRPLENLSGPYEGSPMWHKQEILDYGESGEQQSDCNLRESNMEGMKSNYLSDLSVQELVQDMDTSLLENDVAVLGLRASRGGFAVGDDIFRYLPPSSTSYPSHPSSHPLNQNLVCLPSFSMFSNLSSSTSLPPLSSHNHVREGLELDHLMEILVES
ncbi:SERTA domain-containing protein 3 [Takifugu flavidus]|nr:SERTA domain-containing protein 3 [Takifugu flavidus]XP_056904975.1 SERTA domain-containing protein 3 [Takifugu flavidus]